MTASGMVSYCSTSNMPGQPRQYRGALQGLMLCDKDRSGMPMNAVANSRVVHAQRAWDTVQTMKQSCNCACIVQTVDGIRVTSLDHHCLLGISCEGSYGTGADCSRVTKNDAYLIPLTIKMNN